MSRGARIGATLVAVILAATVMRSPINGLGPILDRIAAEFGLQAAATGLLAAVPLLAFAAVSPFAPRIAERVGLDRAIALFVGAIGLGMLLRMLPHPAALYGGTLLLSAGIAGANVLLPAVVKRDFPGRIAAVTSAYTVVMMCFASLAAFSAHPLSGIGGWRLAASAWLPLVIVAALSWWWGARRMRGAESAETAAEAGVEDRAAGADERAGDAPGIPAHDIPAGRIPARRETALPLGSALAWFCTAYMGLQAFGFFISINWLPRVLADLGAAPAVAAASPGIVQTAQIAAIVAMPMLTRLVARELARSLGAAALLLAGYLGILVMPAAAALWCAAIGLGGGMSIVIALALLSLRTGDHEQAAALSGMSQAGGYLFAALGPPLFAVLHDLTADWRAPILLLVASALAQAAVSPLVARGRIPEHSFARTARGTDHRTPALISKGTEP